VEEDSKSHKSKIPQGDAMNQERDKQQAEENEPKPLVGPITNPADGPGERAENHHYSQGKGSDRPRE